MRKRSLSTNFSQAPSSNSGSGRCRKLSVIAGLIWVLVPAVVLAGLFAAPRLSRLQRSANLYSQAFAFSRGDHVAQSSLGALSPAVPVPEGFRMMGVTHSQSKSTAGVVGLVAEGTVQVVADRYVEAMQRNGWKLAKVDQELGIVTLRRSGSPSFASLLLRPTTGSSVTVVVQVN